MSGRSLVKLAEVAARNLADGFFFGLNTCHGARFSVMLDIEKRDGLSALPRVALPHSGRRQNRMRNRIQEENGVKKAELAKRIKAAAFLTGNFTLRSGKTSSFYWDKYRFESDPVLLKAVADELMNLLPASFDKLAGLELGGIPLATLLSQKTGKPCLYVRKMAKTYGTCNLVEGGFREGDRVLVAEDVITVAGQVCMSVAQMRELGLNIQHVICVIDRQQGGRENLAEIGCTLASVFTMEELEHLTGNSA